MVLVMVSRKPLTSAKRMVVQVVSATTLKTRKIKNCWPIINNYDSNMNRTDNYERELWGQILWLIINNLRRTRGMPKDLGPQLTVPLNLI